MLVTRLLRVSRPTNNSRVFASVGKRLIQQNVVWRTCAVNYAHKSMKISNGGKSKSVERGEGMGYSFDAELCRKNLEPLLVYVQWLSTSRSIFTMVPLRRVHVEILQSVGLTPCQRRFHAHATPQWSCSLLTELNRPSAAAQ